MRYEEVKMRDLKHGDQIAVMGNVADLSPLLTPLMEHTGETYYHHGIYDANNMEVIHFTGESKADAKPKRSDFPEFFAGHKQLYLVVYEDHEECLPVQEVMKRAEDALKQARSWPGYDIIKNNCETFACYLKTGKARSKQAMDALVMAAIKFTPIVASAAVKIGGSLSGSKGSGKSGSIGSGKSGSCGSGKSGSCGSGKSGSSERDSYFS